MKKLASVLALLALGCGSSSGSNGGGGGVPVEQFPQKYAEAICGQNFKCCDASELAGKTMSGCVSSNQSGLTLFVSIINDSVAKGRSGYSAQQMGACIASLKALSCDDFKKQTGENQAACMAAITPKVALGGACQGDFECIGGVCPDGDPGTLSGMPMDGTCVTAPVEAAIGQSCANGPCASGYCDPADSTCKALKGAGESCDPNSLAGECANTCDMNTSKCTCYAGCAVAGPMSPRTTALSLALLALVFTARLRRGPSKGPRTPPR
jgi:hypothetical protein